MRRNILHLYRAPRRNRVIILEDADFIWDEDELEEMITLWNKGVSAKRMGAIFKRDPDDVLLALIHLAKQDLITRRENGLL
jgi:hypothetical protein